MHRVHNNAGRSSRREASRASARRCAESRINSSRLATADAAAAAGSTCLRCSCWRWLAQIEEDTPLVITEKALNRQTSSLQRTTVFAVYTKYYTAAKGHVRTATHVIRNDDITAQCSSFNDKHATSI
jgi:hypothetical protein